MQQLVSQQFPIMKFTSQIQEKMELFQFIITPSEDVAQHPHLIRLKVLTQLFHTGKYITSSMSPNFLKNPKFTS